MHTLVSICALLLQWPCSSHRIQQLTRTSANVVCVFVYNPLNPVRAVRAECRTMPSSADPNCECEASFRTAHTTTLTLRHRHDDTEIIPAHLNTQRASMYKCNLLTKQIHTHDSKDDDGGVGVEGFAGGIGSTKFRMCHAVQLNVCATSVRLVPDDDD